MANPADYPFAEQARQCLIDGVAIGEWQQLGRTPDTPAPCSTHAGHDVLFG